MTPKARFVPMMALLLIGALDSATAKAGVVVNFSSTDDFGVPASDLSARVTFTEVNNASPATGGTLTIKVENLSAGYNLADLTFNALNGGSMTVTSVTSNQVGSGPTLSDSSVSGSGNPLQQPADGYGKFGYDLNWGVSAGDRLAPGKTVTFVATYTGTISDADLEATVTKTYGANSAVLHFFSTDGKYTGYAGSGGNVTTQQALPEPSTFGAALVGIGLVALWRNRRRRAVTA